MEEEHVRYLYVFLCLWVPFEQLGTGAQNEVPDLQKYLILSVKDADTEAVPNGLAGQELVWSHWDLIPPPTC